jgi:hypothetical protein
MEETQMGKRFVLAVGEEKAICELLDDAAPTIAYRFWNALPLESFAIHAKFAGGEMIVMVPFHAEPENKILNVSAGDIGYFPEMQTLCLFYGSVTPFGEVSVFARVGENLKGIQKVAEGLVQHVSAPVRIERLQKEGVS